METFFWGTGIFLLVNAFLCLWRAYAGPTIVDRILSINIVGTKTLVVVALLGVVFGRSIYIDIALVYGLLNFVVTIAAARFLETERLRGDWS